MPTALSDPFELLSNKQKSGQMPLAHRHTQLPAVTPWSPFFWLMYWELVAQECFFSAYRFKP
jgi:hypothetical protein